MVIKKIFWLMKYNERGAALIEFAIITPVLILLVMGIIQFGWVFNAWISITSSAREGARMAIIKIDAEDYETLVTEAVENHATVLNITNVGISTENEKVNGTELDSVTVLVEGELELLINNFFLPNPLTLVGEATMRQY